MKMIRILFAAAVTIFSIGAIAASSSESHLPESAEPSRDDNPCASAVFLVEDHLGLDNNANVLARTCKAWPNDESKTIVAFVYDYGEKYVWKLVVALISDDEILPVYQGETNGDATTRWSDAGFELDTARYTLSETTRAFGLRISNFHSQCSYEGGSSNDFTLFVVEKNQIRPVLSGISLKHWCLVDGSNCDGTDETVEASSFVSVAPTISQGYHDLVLTTKYSNNKQRGAARQDFVKLKYNGSIYPASWHFNSCR